MSSDNKFGKTEGPTLQRWVLIRKLTLQELLSVETKQCSICDFNREILYYGNYDGIAACFDVCELCGKELIDKSVETLLEILGKPKAEESAP